MQVDGNNRKRRGRTAAGANTRLNDHLPECNDNTTGIIHDGELAAGAEAVLVHLTLIGEVCVVFHMAVEIERRGLVWHIRGQRRRDGRTWMGSE